MKSNADTAERTRRTTKLIDLPAHDSQFVEPPPAVDDGVESSFGIMIATALRGALRTNENDFWRHRLSSSWEGEPEGRNHSRYSLIRQKIVKKKSKRHYP